MVPVAGQTRLTKRQKRHATNEQESTRPPLLPPVNIKAERHGLTSPTTLLILLFVTVLTVACLIFSETKYLFRISHEVSSTIDPDLQPKPRVSRFGPGTVTLPGALKGAAEKFPFSSSAASKDLMFLAFYYSWYNRDDWSQYGTQGSSPMLGLYGSNESEVAERHIDMAVRGGIDAWVVSWWSQDSPVTANFIKGMLSAKNIDKIKFCMLYESMGNLPVDSDFANGTLALDKFIADMIFFRDSCFGHPSYLHINGRPVVYVYVTRFWKNFEPFMLDKIKTAVGSDILIIADDPYFGHNKDPATAQNGVKNGNPVFEAYTSYNMYENEFVREGERAVDYMLREAFPIFVHWSKETVFFPHVLPKYHDFRQGHTRMMGDAAGLLKQLEIFACLPRPSWYNNEFPNLIFVTSFNEWWEGTSIEPDVKDEYGFTFLDTIKAFKDSRVHCQRVVLSHMQRWYDLDQLWNFLLGC
jgi:hypothetical protein